MSILSMSRGRNAPPQRPEPAIPYAPRPKPGPQQLGTTSLAALDQITEMSAAEIEKVADQLETAAHETAEGLRECARRMRVTGVLAQERVGNFVRVATTCTDAARMMQQSVEQRDEPQPERKPHPEAQVEPPADVNCQPGDGPADLDAIERNIAEVAREGNGG